jgi:hypothetical protein
MAETKWQTTFQEQQQNTNTDHTETARMNTDKFEQETVRYQLSHSALLSVDNSASLQTNSLNPRFPC